MSRLLGVHRWALPGALMCVWLAPELLLAQAAAPAEAKPAAAAADAAAEKPAPGAKPKKPPAPEDIQLSTRDGVELVATYFGSLKGKDAVPVILVHGYKGSRNDFKDLAFFLQAQGHAVLAVDLRGHGDSTKTKAGTTLDPATMPADNFYRMVDTDMERFKGWLVNKNNAGDLNIEKLCVVGVEMGAIVAAEWARVDWSWPVLATGKQGQDVKALVLVSPKFAERSLKLGQALSSPVVKNLSVLILVGKGESKASREASRLFSAFKKYHPDPPEEKKAEAQDLFFGKLDTSLQGAKMLGAKGLGIDNLIAQFITIRLVKKTEYAWKERAKL